MKRRQLFLGLFLALLWPGAQADELVFVDPWFPRTRLLIVPERQPRTIIIRPRGSYQAPVDHCKTKAQADAFCRGAAWCICWDQEEEKAP